MSSSRRDAGIRSLASRGVIPVAPLARQIERWMEDQAWDVDDSRQEIASPKRVLAERLWPGMPWDGAARALLRILTESKYITFDLADKIICQGLDQPELWITDPDLSDAYQNLDLRALDVTSPTCERAERMISRKVIRTYKRTKSIRATAAKLGVSQGRIKEIVAGAA